MEKKYKKESIKENKKEQKVQINLCGTLKPITKISCKDYDWLIINKAKHEPTTKNKWSDIYNKFREVDNNILNFCFKCPSTLLEKHKYKLFNIE